jgi:hypothetical protein
LLGPLGVPLAVYRKIFSSAVISLGRRASTVILLLPSLDHEA